jgi:hypothetical protein
VITLNFLLLFSIFKTLIKMKKTIFSAIICCLCAVLYVNAASVKSTPTTVITAAYSNDTFDKQLEKALASLKEGQALTIKQDGDNYTFTVGDDGDTGPSEMVRCTGSGMKFAKCAKAAIDEHGCQKVSSTGGGNYKSEDC